MIDSAIPASVLVSEEPDGTIVLRIAGELDAECRDAVEPPMLLALTTASAVVVDLDGLTFCDSSGVRAFIAANEKANADGVPFRLRNVKGMVRRVFEITGVDQVLDIIERDAT